MRLFNTVVFGFGKGLYDLFGDAASATATSIGEDLIEEMEHEMGLEIQGTDARPILIELGRLMQDEYGLFKTSSMDMTEGGFVLHCQHCELWHATEEMLASGAKPFHCVPMMLLEATFNKRLGKRLHFRGLTQDKENRICNIDFSLG